VARPVLSALALALAAACGEPRDVPSDPLKVEPATSLSSTTRPRARYVMTRTSERCVIERFEEDAPRETLVPDVACPKDLEVGERIRLIGMTCAREGGATRERNVPVVCPPTLTRAERDRRETGGPPDAG
jgi:hypothetical protein